MVLQGDLFFRPKHRRQQAGALSRLYKNVQDNRLNKVSTQKLEQSTISTNEGMECRWRDRVEKLRWRELEEETGEQKGSRGGNRNRAGRN